MARINYPERREIAKRVGANFIRYADDLDIRHIKGSITALKQQRKQQQGFLSIDDINFLEAYFLLKRR